MTALPFSGTLECGIIKNGADELSKEAEKEWALAMRIL